MIDARGERCACPRLQFSLRSLFVLTAVVAVVMSVSVPLYRERAAATRERRFSEAVRTR